MANLATVAEGSERPAIPVIWTTANNDTGLDLTGATLSGYLKDLTSGEVQEIQGTFNITDAASGAFTWTPDPIDVAADGAYQVQFSAVFAGEPTPARSIVFDWAITESIIPTDPPTELPDYQGVVKMQSRTTDPDNAPADYVGLFIKDGTLYTIDEDGLVVGPVIGDFTIEMAQDAAADLFTTATHDGVSTLYTDAAGTLAITNTDKGSTAVSSHVSDTTPHETMYGAIKLGGDSSNYVGIAADGMLTLVGTARVWDDIRIEPTVRSIGTFAPSFEQYFTNGAGSRGVYLYSFDDAAVNAEKEIYFTLQLPHAWAQTAIDVHVHFVPFATVNSSAIRWGLEYTWAEIGAVFGNTTIVYASVAAGSPANMVANTHYVTEFAELTPSASQDDLSSILIGRLFRNSSHADDTYTNKAGLLYIDAHIELNKMGSNSEYS